jgi:uncharacterized protein YbjT (DUF2867 family)
MSQETILITGATGNVGGATLRSLAERPDRVVRVGLRDPDSVGSLPGDPTSVHLDFANTNTFGPSLAGVDRLLLIRPPMLANVRRYFEPFVRAAENAGVKQVVFLSVMGVEEAPFIPHAKIEKLLAGSSISYTFLRAGFFDQNLSTTHAADIRDGDRVFVPAGTGKTAFVDVRDIGEVAARVLTEDGHQNTAYTLTSYEALDYYEVARILSEELGRDIRYERPGALRFIAKELRGGTSLKFALLMAGVYMPTRLGRTGTSDDALAGLIGRPPVSFRAFVRDHLHAWISGSVPVTP